MYSQINNLITSTISCTEDEIKFANSLFSVSSFVKDSIILNYDEIESNLYFINRGFIRCYYATEDDDVSLSISTSNEFLTSILSFFYGEKSKIIIQCLTDCELIIISKQNLELLYKRDSIWQEFGRKIMENALIEKEERILDQISLSAEERYLKLLKQKPDIIQNCQVKYIASLLGIHPESLSRIRRNVVS